jgi:5-hydroxyisourate hydrolase-like protein (transthyretin family)
MTSYDKYQIAHSDEIISEGAQENHIDISLIENANINVGVITGTVLTSAGLPVSNATVKLTTADLKDYTHATTNVVGKFTLTSIPIGSYLISATKEDYTLSNPISLTVRKNKKTDIDIIIDVDPNSNKNIIFGIIKSDIAPIESAFVQLYKVEGTEEIYMGMSVTNESGQYLFINIDDGSYLTRVTKIGYFDAQSLPTDIAGKEYLPIDVLLIPDTSNNGVIFGTINDSDTKEPINNAVVALYSIEDNIETIIQITKTNLDGKYLFGNIPSGKYRVKSTVQAYEE